MSERANALHVLLIEDPHAPSGAAELLRQEGHQVRVVPAMRGAATALDERRFDLVLLDAERLASEGLAVAQAVRDRGDGTPLVALVGSAQPRERARLFSAGVDGLVEKPIGSTALSGAVQDALTPYDPTELLGVVDGDLDLLAELVGLFVTQSPNTIASLRLALVAGLTGDVERIAHRFKGSLLSLTARPAAQLAQRLELAGRTGRLTGLDEPMEALARATSRLMETLARAVDRASP